MSILWVGGEDTSFPNGVSPSVDTNTARFRTSYNVRCAIWSTSGLMKSTIFPGGAVMSCWFSARVYVNLTPATSIGLAGLGLSGTSKGLFVGVGSAANKVALLKYDGSTWTVLDTETGTSLSTQAIHRIDMQLVSYGASATVVVYWDLTPLFTYNGDVTVSGVTNLDSVFYNSANTGLFSEPFVASDDSRARLGIGTMVGTSNGTTQQFSNPAFTNFNPVTINDANSTFVNTTSQDEQVNLTDEPSGIFVVEAIKIEARAFATAGSVATKVALGFNSGGSVAVAAGHTLAVAPATYEDYFTQNPVTVAAWGTSTEVNALQLDLRSS